MKETLAIVGNFPDTRNLFDYSRQDCDIWLFNESMSIDFFQRADAVFQMHAPAIWKNPKNRNDANHYLWLTNKTDTCRSCLGKGKHITDGVKEVPCKACNATGTYTPAENRKDISIYMQEVEPEVPNSKRYPIEEIKTRFQTDYFSSSVSYAVALGIHLGYQRIEIFGVGLATDTEYRYQRDGFTFWCGIAKGCGVDLVYHGDIFSAPMYGYGGDVTLDYEVFTKRIAELEPQMKAALDKCEVARDNITKKSAEFMATGLGHDEITQIAQEQIKTANEYGMLDGAKQENERYVKKADAMREASGEFIFSRQEFEQAGQAIFKERAEALSRVNVLAPQCEQTLRIAAGTKNKLKRQKRFADFATVYQSYINLSVAIGMYSGALAENSNFLKILDERIKAAGGSKSEEVLLEALQNA